MRERDILLLAAGVVAAWLSDKAISNNNSIGKIEDLNFPKGGRIDQYWRSNIDVDPSKIIGRRISIHDLNTKYPISVDRVIEKYGLKGLEFGNWMNQYYRVYFLIGISVSLNDLAKCLKIPQNSIGQSALSIASGARGRSMALAHYEGGSYNVINLTKTRGFDGVLAHEYGHFIDKELLWPSGRRSTRMQVKDVTKHDRRDVRYLMEQVIRWLYFDENMKPTEYYWLQKRETAYYRYRTEVWARCFEVYIQIRLKELGLTNNFLMTQERKSDLPSRKLVSKARPFIEKIIKVAF